MLFGLSLSYLRFCLLVSFDAITAANSENTCWQSSLPFSCVVLCYGLVIFIIIIIIMSTSLLLLLLLLLLGLIYEYIFLIHAKAIMMLWILDTTCTRNHLLLYDANDSRATASET